MASVPEPADRRRLAPLAIAVWLLAALASGAELRAESAEPGRSASERVWAERYRTPVEAEELWLLELRLGGRHLQLGLLSIDRDGELLLPLGEVADAFELAIDVDPERASASGFLVHPGRHFELSLEEDELHIEGHARDLTASQIVVWSEDIYVDAPTLSTWLPVDLEVSRRQMSVSAYSREPLPIEKRLERERVHRRLGMRRQEIQGESREDAYRWWSRPALDVNLRSRVQRPELGGSHDWESYYDITAAGDLLKLQTELLWSGVGTRSSRLRARAGRIDPEGRMGGPLGLREFTIGDVYTPADSMISSGRSGRGFQLSSFPPEYLNELGQFSLEGDLQPGYQVELYRNDVLLDFQTAGADLRYRFEDVPTVPGLNVLRLVFYGPRGEMREEEKRFWSDGGIAPAGETRFRIAVNQHDEDTLRFGEADADDRLRGEPRALGELEHGLSENLTLALGAASIPLLEGQQHYGSLALRSDLDGHLLRLEGFGGHEGGSAVGFGWQTRLGNHSVGLSHHELHDFLSERTREFGGERLEGRSEATLDGRFDWRRLPISYRLATGYSRLAGGNGDVDGTLRISTWLRPVYITHSLRGNLDRDFAGNSENLTGDLLASFRRGPWGLRGRFLYSAVPGEAQALALIGDWSPRALTSTRMGITHAFGDRTTFFASLSRQIGFFIVSADMSVDRDGIASAGVGLSFGGTPNPLTDRTHWQDPGATRSGSVAARAFLDHNANGRFDEGDRGLPDVGFVTRGHDRPRTDDRGTALLTSLPAHVPVQVGLDTQTLRDPHWLIPEKREQVVLRPGTPMQLEFPIVPVGEIDGWVRSEELGFERRALPGITLQLLDEAGEPVATTRSEVDGFFIFQQVLPGRYRLRLDPEQLQRMGFEAPPEREIRIETGGSIRSDESFLLRRSDLG